jgi:DNA-binding FrmR family transcriptional regulator
MTREEMLKKMGLTSEELTDLMQQLAQLRASLNDAQRAVLDRSLPTHSAAATTFGADVTAGDLQKLLKADQQGGFAGAAVATQVQNP